MKLEDAGGKPVDAAGLSVTFFMPAMPAMGMAAITVKEQLKSEGNGLYHGRCVLSSGGPYQVSVTVQKDGQVIGSKQLRVNATGGM